MCLRNALFALCRFRARAASAVMGALLHPAGFHGWFAALLFGTG
jgi:hypothetical protein